MESTYCLGCKHYEWAGYCKAFPNGIPKEIIIGTMLHDKPIEGDNGFRYEQDKLGDLLEGKK